MLAVGLMIIGALCYYPYSLALISNAQHAVSAASAAFVQPPPAEDATDSAKLPPKPVVSPFDVALWFAAHNEEPEKHGVLIETLDGEQVFASHNPDVTFNPASLIKLTTTLAALKKLGPEYRFETRVYADGKTDAGGTLRGKLYVMGEDPTFGDVAGSMIAHELRARGIKRVTGGIIVSPNFCFNFSESAEDSAARLARVLNLGRTAGDVAEQPAGEQLFVFDSYPLRDILLYMNAHSSNFVAERIGALVGGPGGVEQFLINDLNLPADQVTIERTSGRGHNRLTPRGMVAVIRALSAEAERDHLHLEDVMPVAGDDVGTLRRRLAGTGLEGAVIGKTGTLTSEVDGGMASLAGLVYTQNSGPILFAILDQGNRIGEHRQMEDQLLDEVVRLHDAPRAVPVETPRQLLPASSLQVLPAGREQTVAGE